jgi:hypothetical protein
MDQIRKAVLKNYNVVNNTRKCSRCQQWLDLSEFKTRIVKCGKLKVPTLTYRCTCNKCSLEEFHKVVHKYTNPEALRSRHQKDPRKRMFKDCRFRSQQKGIEFNISLDDLEIPKKCPLLNIVLSTSNSIVSPNSPTIDRIDSTKGYIKGNVWIISHKANTAKNNLTLKELKLLTKNLQKLWNQKK